MLTAELTQTKNPEALSISAIVDRHNKLAEMLQLKTVKRFENKSIAVQRLVRIEAEARARFSVTPAKKKRQKVFNYPPLEAIKALKPGSLRAEARDLLLGGATLAKVEELVASWDVRSGKKPHRLEPRAYGLVRLLHYYIGYALREEGVGENKVIYVMDREAWAEWKKNR